MNRAHKKFLFTTTNIYRLPYVIKGIAFATCNGMDTQSPGEEERPRKFQLTIGDKIVLVEIISLANYIYSVEISGQEPIFITRIRENNKSCWISIPQGHNDLAAVIGNYIDEKLYSKHHTDNG